MQCRVFPVTAGVKRGTLVYFPRVYIPKVYFSLKYLCKVYFSKIYPTCVSSKLFEFIFLERGFPKGGRGGCLTLGKYSQKIPFFLADVPYLLVQNLILLQLPPLSTLQISPSLAARPLKYIHPLDAVSYFIDHMIIWSFEEAADWKNTKEHW